MRIEYKSYSFGELKTLDIDPASRRVKSAFSKVDEIDTDKDIIDQNAYNKTLQERGPAAKNLIWHLTDHIANTDHAIGKFSELYVDRTSKYLVGVTNFPNTSKANDMLAHYEAGNINQHSIGFSTVKRDVFNDDDYSKRYTIIRELKLYEGSSVLWGANENTPNLTVGKSIEEAQNALDQYLNQLDSLFKFMRTAKASDEAFELVDLRILQLKEDIQKFFDQVNKYTEPAKAVQPELCINDHLQKTKQLLMLKAQL